MPYETRTRSVGGRKGSALYLSLTVLALVGASCSARPASSVDTVTPTSEERRLSGALRSPAPVVSDLVLPDVSPAGGGSPFVLRAKPGHLLLVYFGYTGCPDVCPTTFAVLRSAIRDLGPDANRVDVAMVTVDPARDTPEALSTYLAHFFTSYHALRTTDPAALAQVEKPFGVRAEIEGDPSSGSYGVSHTATVFAVNQDGKIVVEWPFGIQSAQVAGDLRILLEDMDNKEEMDNKGVQK